jgi:hypothetical protein
MPVSTSPASYITAETGDAGYAAFTPNLSGLYTIVVESGNGEAAEASAEAAAAEASADPEPKYAYKHSDNLGDSYWLVNTETRTVETYHAGTGKYRTGEYTGSLSGGLEVTFQGSGETASLKLKFKDNYKYVSLKDDGPEQFIKREDAAAVETVIAGHR